MAIETQIHAKQEPPETSDDKESITPLYDNLSDAQKNLILRHLEAVIEVNRNINLTRIDDKDEALLLHVEDSLTALPEVNDAPEGFYADLGSGAGYPGIPLAVATGRTSLLVDARKKKMDVLAEIIFELGLQEQVSTYAGRAELLARSKGKQFSVITARALSKLSVLLELASPLLKRHGVLICYKSHVEEDEMNDALRVQGLVGMKLKSDRAFKLQAYDRRIIVFEKTGNPKVSLPRQEGQAQKNPL